jgi:spore photoproduct lyase
VSCYTDPLGIEHLTGSLAECIRYFGTRTDGYLRWVSKFDAVDALLDLAHNGHTRCRVSVNAAPASMRFEGRRYESWLCRPLVAVVAIQLG